MNDPTNWPRTAAGTLQCPCGLPGEIFTCLDVALGDDLEMHGLFGGFCSADCHTQYNQSLECQALPAEQPAKPSLLGKQQSMF